MSGESAARIWMPEQDNELLSLDSATVAFVDLGDAAELAQQACIDPPPEPDGWPSWMVGNAVVCAAGQDGAVEFVGRGTDQACAEIEIWLDEPTDKPMNWTRAGTIHAASGVLLIADPYLLDQYTVERYDGPLFAAGLWIELHLPAPGDVAIDLGMPEDAGQWETPAVARARWLTAAS